MHWMTPEDRDALEGWLVAGSRYAKSEAPRQTVGLGAWLGAPVSRVDMTSAEFNDRLESLWAEGEMMIWSDERTDTEKPKNKTMRTILDHKVNEANEALGIQVLDQPGAGGANHLYAIYGFHSKSNPSADALCDDDTRATILFQNGPIKEAGVNGITQEALIAICIDRLRCFQAGPYACRENAEALTYLETAQMWLLKRTRDRLARGVEGTHQK